jgi:uncharacterized protein YecE (DUF72 family)
VIRLGTSGYSYDDWKGYFYPESLPKPEMLTFYSRELRSTEVNFTYYAMPNPRTLAAMAKKTPDDFVFTLKATKEMTHDRTADQNLFNSFRLALEPLIEVGKFGCVLAQFPNSFHPEAGSRDYLRQFKERLTDLPVVVEFRNSAWLSEATFDLLRELNLGFCCVDEPRLKGLLPPLAVATSSIAYVRFHGRNAKQWWQHEEAWQRYDYSYSDEELAEWVPKIAALNREVATTYVFTNNHWHGQAVQTVRQLKFLLEQYEGIPAGEVK